jgi:hypothetical protein
MFLAKFRAFSELYWVTASQTPPCKRQIYLSFILVPKPIPLLYGINTIHLWIIHNLYNWPRFYLSIFVNQREFNSRSVGQEIPHLLRNPKVHHSVHKSSLLGAHREVGVSIPYHYISILWDPIYFILSIDAYILRGVLSCQGISITLWHAFDISPMRVTCSNHLIIFDFIILVMSGLRSSKFL